MDFLKQLGMFFGWLSGVIAGFTAVLYGLGFMATVSHQGLLGLDWAITPRETLWYLGLGGQVAAHWALLAMVALLLVLIGGESLRWVVRRLRGKDDARPGRVAAAARWLDRNVVWFIALMAMVLIGIMMGEFAGALQISDLLFAGTEKLCGGGGVFGDIVAADRIALLERANKIAFYAALALGVGWYAAPRLISREGPAIPLLICLAVALQALGAIPASHGIFVLDTSLRSVAADGAVIETFPEGSLRLLARTRDGLWAWEPASRAVHWFAEGTFGHLRIGDALPIRALACPENLAGAARLR